jgi:hypothetical protein
MLFMKGEHRTHPVPQPAGLSISPIPDLRHSSIRPLPHLSILPFHPLPHLPPLRWFAGGTGGSLAELEYRLHRPIGDDRLSPARREIGKSSIGLGNR